MKIIIPMAGLGTRFQKAEAKNPEYRKPKPFINVKGHPMIRWATASLPFPYNPKDLTFIILKHHDDQYGIAQKLREIYSSDINVIILNSVTRGAAETAYMAK